MHFIFIATLCLLAERALALSAIFRVSGIRALNANETFVIDNARMIIEVTEANVSSLTAYFNKTFRIDLPEPSLVPNISAAGAELTVQAVVNLPLNLSRNVDRNSGDCTPIFGVECLNEIQANYFARQGNRTSIMSFPQSQSCRSVIGNDLSSRIYIQDLIGGVGNFSSGDTFVSDRSVNYNPTNRTLFNNAVNSVNMLIFSSNVGSRDSVSTIFCGAIAPQNPGSDGSTGAAPQAISFNLSFMLLMTVVVLVYNAVLV